MLSYHLTIARLESIFQHVSTFRVKVIRDIMSCMRQEGSNGDTFMPRLGLTCGEFSTAYILNRETASSRRR